MKILTRFFCFVFLCTGFMLASYAQDTAKTVIALQPYTGIMIFPSPTFSSPSPMAGLSTSIFVNAFEFEIGAYYYRKYDSQKPENTGTPQVPVYPYQSVSYVQDYINMYILMNTKMMQQKRHIITGYFGLAFRKNLSWSSDTLYNNNTTSRNPNVTTKAERGVGVSLIGGFKYMFMCTKFLNLVTGLNAGVSIEEEYSLAPNDYTPEELLEYQRPLEPRFQLGISIGIQFMLSKKKGRFFIQRQKDTLD